ncbi:MAG: AMP-binding protein [Gemmatimonadetes bacterium]|nr:AMP-binding protein [Gemmatimonadota bacterium]
MTSAAAFPARFDPVAWWSRVDGDRVALVDGATDATITYRALDAEADRWLALLRAEGVAPGDRVAILAQNRPAFVPLFVACARAAAALVPLNWRLAAPELGRVLADAAPRLLLGEGAFRATAEAAVAHADALGTHGNPLPAARWLDLDHEVAARLAAVEPATGPLPPVEAETAAMLLYTSGSTGLPKGVIIPHRQLLWNAIATTTAWQLGADDVGPSSTPFFHTGGWNVFTTPLLYRGGRVLLTPAFDPAAFLEMLARHGVTVAFGVPTQLAMLTETPQWGRPLPRLRFFIAGGAPCPSRLKAAVWDAGYAMREGYGLTECGPNCFATTNAAARAKPGTVGWPVPGLQMRLRRDDGTVAGVDEVGELELHGPQQCGGYFRNPAQTAALLTADGWLRTGDLASRDAEGAYSIRGRRKEMFISGGENVFPGEVEAALLEHPGVLEVAVVGVPDARWGEVGCAWVVPRTPALSVEALLDDARRRLARYKVPRHVRLVDALPRLGSGKIDRAALARAE